MTRVEILLLAVLKFSDKDLFEQNDKTILGMIRVDVGVARIGLGASWVKSGVVN